jgi:hypothetical protein
MIFAHSLMKIDHFFQNFYDMQICMVQTHSSLLSYESTALCLGLGLFFSFLIYILYDSLDEGSAHRKASAYTE